MTEEQARMTDEQVRMTSEIDTIEINLSQLTLDTQQLTTDYTNLELRVLDLETTLVQRVQALENWIPAFAEMTAEEISSLLAGINVQLALPEEFLSLQQALLENKIEFDAEGNLKVKKLEAEEVEITGDDIYIKSPEKGVIMKSAGGKCFKMTVSEEGEMQSIEQPCPEETP